MALSTKRILVTGGSGFLGRHVLTELKERGFHRVIAPSRSRLDLTQPDQIRALMDREMPQIVIHLAARVGGIGANRQYPGTYFYQNLSMGIQLIEECRLRDVERFVAVGTICSYPKFPPVPFREEDFWNGYPEETNAPYGFAKKMLAVQLQAYRQEFGFDGVNLLLTNLFGPHDNFDEQSSHVIPALIRKFVHAQELGSSEVEIWGTGNATREFLFVTDAARAIVLAMERLDTSEPMNIGTGREISIRDLALPWGGKDRLSRRDSLQYQPARRPATPLSGRRSRTQPSRISGLRVARGGAGAARSPGIARSEWLSAGQHRSLAR